MARLGAHVRRRLTNDVIWKRAITQTVNAFSSTLIYSPPSGQWTTAALSRNSCTSQAESTISFNSSVSLVFVGTSLSVNIIKDTNGAPYNVTLDGNVSQYDSYAASQQCTADFQAFNLDEKQHTVIVTHNGKGDLSASGRSTLYFVSFDYTSSGNNTQAGGSPTVGAIVGGVVGAIAVVLLCGFLWWFLRRRKARAEAEKENGVSYEPFEPAYAITQYPPHDNDGGPVQETGGSSQHLASAQHHQPPRTKGAEAANNSRFVRTSPWASLSSNNRSRPNMAGESGLSGSDAQTSSQSPSESLRPTSLSQYPPSGTEFCSPAPVVMQPLQEATAQSSRRYNPPPSTVGESVLIDDSDYTAPPSYSPPPSSHLRHSVRREVQEKATYEGTGGSGGSSANLLSPNSTHQALPGGPMPGPSSQTLSRADIDVIARRVADIMRSPSSTTGSQYSGVSSSDAANPQVQQAVRVLLAKEDEEHPQTTLAPPKPPNAGD